MRYVGLERAHTDSPSYKKEPHAGAAPFCVFRQMDIEFYRALRLCEELDSGQALLSEKCQIVMRYVWLGDVGLWEDICAINDQFPGEMWR